jgi:hypothetical protein
MPLRNFATFVIAEPYDGPLAGQGEPLGQRLADRLVAALRSSGVSATDPSDSDYCWDFRCPTEHLTFDCRLGLVEPEGGGWRWLLCCYPRRSPRDWWRGRLWLPEQEWLLGQVDRALSHVGGLHSVRWYTQQEWDAPNGVGENLQ